MAELMIDAKCENCNQNNCVLFCDNMFTDFYCKNCKATNLAVTLPKLETKISCISLNEIHSVRIAKNNILFCVKCKQELGKLKGANQ